MLRGAAQVMFQSSPWCGVLFMIGIFWGSFAGGTPEVAWGAVAGLVVATATGHALGYSEEDGRQGLWGFNGILVGCATMTFLGSTPLGWVALLLCAAMVTWVRQGLNRLATPLGVTTYTFPFVLCSWIFLSAARAFGGLEVTALAHPMLPQSVVHATEAHPQIIDLWTFTLSTLRGVSQVFLIDNPITGLLFLAGLAVSSVRAALWALVGSALATAVAALFGAPIEAIYHGMYGFSATLTAIALGATLLPRSSRTTLWALLGTVGTVFVQASANELLLPVGIPSLTAPFCIATWLFILPTISKPKD